MDNVTVSATKGADCFVFDYNHLNVGYTVSLGTGYWGFYKADSTVAVGNTLTPQIGTDGVTSQAGTFTTSISLSHLDAYTTARVHYDGSGFTLDYTLNGGTSWTTLSEDGVIVLPANADLDLRVSFPGGIANDPAVLNTLTVYILNSETLTSMKSVRQATVTDLVVTNNTISTQTTGITVPAQAGTDGSYNIGTIEMIATVSVFNSWNTLFDTNGTPYSAYNASGQMAGKTNHYDGCSVYVNGVSVETASPLVSGTSYHFVFSFDTPANLETFIGIDRTGATAAPLVISHLAFYQQQMSATDAAGLYAQQTATQTVTVNDTATITLSEYSPTVDIYAYAWQIQSGGS